MFHPRLKTAAFLLEGLNSIGATFYFYFIYWYLDRELGFSSRENLAFGVGHGLIYVFASLQGGGYGQRHGYLRALRIGFGGMAACFLLSWIVARVDPSRGIQVALLAILMAFATVAMCFTWPNLEAIVSEGEPGPVLQRHIGIYNLVWSGTGAAAYFAGGALFSALGGAQLVMLLPALILGAQWFYTHQLLRAHGPALARPAAHGPLSDDVEKHRSRLSPRQFLRMSWLANPCAYVAINAAVPMIPNLAERLELSPGPAGFFCSIWLFARTLTFLGLWKWNGWHYRFGWLVTAFLALIAGFLVIFLGAEFSGLSAGQILLLLTAAQLVFGAGLGLIYYSSLFYSMDVGDTKGDHGGIHEAAIGVGILGGPLVGVLAQVVRPGSTTASAWAVGAVLTAGLGALIVLRFRRDPP